MGKTHGKLNQRMPWFCWMPWKDPWEIIINQWPESQNKCLHINPTCVWIAWAVCDCIYHTCSQYCNSLFFFSGRHCGSHRSIWWGNVCPTCIESNGLVFMLGIKFLQPAMANRSLTHMYLPHVGCRFFSECLYKVYCETLGCWLTRYVYRIRFHKMFLQNVLRNMGMHHRMLISQLLSQSVYTKLMAREMGLIYRFLSSFFTKCIHQVYLEPHGHFAIHVLFTNCKHQVYCKWSVCQAPCSCVRQMYCSICPLVLKIWKCIVEKQVADMFIVWLARGTVEVQYAFKFRGIDPQGTVHPQQGIK